MKRRLDPRQPRPVYHQRINQPAYFALETGIEIEAPGERDTAAPDVTAIRVPPKLAASLRRQPLDARHKRLKRLAQR